MITERNPKKFRHELKYVVTEGELILLRNRLQHLLCLDRHATQAGRYTIRSLYFDDYDNRCFYENENGTDPREKFRIRFYNHDLSRISLECKQKVNGMTHKQSCLLTLEQAQRLTAGEILPNIGEQPPLLQKLTMQMLTRRLHPVVIVEYERVPYVSANGNVRITLDADITSSSQVEDFLHPMLTKRPIMPKGQQLLEVKYDEFLPDVIYRSLQLENLQRTAFSKFYLSRKFTV